MAGQVQVCVLLAYASPRSYSIWVYTGTGMGTGMGMGIHWYLVQFDRERTWGT
jgi:hypothetical protein